MNLIRGTAAIVALAAVGCGGLAPPIDPDTNPPPKTVPPNDPPATPPPQQQQQPTGQSQDQPTKPDPTQELRTKTTSIPANHCVTFAAFDTEEYVVDVDLTTGISERGVKISGGSTFGVTSLGVKAGEAWFCAGLGGTGVVAKVSMTTGTMTKYELPCEAVTASEESVVVLADNLRNVGEYDDEVAIVAKVPSRTMGGFRAERVGIAKNGVMSSWHASDEVFLPTSTLGLTGFDGWIYGVSEATGGRIIVSSPAHLGGQGGLLAFDGRTGASLGRVASIPMQYPSAPDELRGIACGL